MRKTYFCQRLARKQMKPFSFVLVAQYNCKLFVHNAMSESDILWFMSFEPYRYDTTEQSARRIHRRSDPPDIASAVAVTKEQVEQENNGCRHHNDAAQSARQNIPRITLRFLLLDHRLIVRFLNLILCVIECAIDQKPHADRY